MKQLMITAIIFITAGSVSLAQDVVPHESQIDKAVSHAKASGQSTAQLPVTIREYPVVTSLRQALKLTVPMRVLIDGKQTYVSSGRDFLVTLYRVQVLENLESFPLPGSQALDDNLLPLSSYSTLPDSSFYVLVHGGTLTIDGIKIADPEKPDSLVVGSQYVLFVRFERDRGGALTRVATLPLGDAGIYSYNPSTDSLRTRGFKDNRELRSDILSQSLSAIRSLSSDPSTPKVATR